MTRYLRIENGPLVTPDTRAMLDGIETAMRRWWLMDVAVCCSGMSSCLPIHADDLAMVANAVESRRAEFIAARWCAYCALIKIGRPAERVPAGPLGSPVWPEGIVGSITHESGICVAAVAHASQFGGIGIDLLDMRRDVNMAEIESFIMGAHEAQADSPCADRSSYLKLAFSAKEAVVKAVSAKVGRYLDLREIQVSIDADTFHASLPDFPYRIVGNWTDVGPFFLTMAIVEHRPCKEPQTC